MTPIAGFIIAIIAGWLVPSGRRAAAVVVIPWLAVLAEQTWILAAGRGHSPPSTVSQLPGAIGYWLVQVALLAVALSIAWLLGALRAHRPQRPDAAGRPRRPAAIASGLLATAAAVFVVVGVLTSAPVHHHLAGGSPPAIGFIGMALELVTVAALGVATIMRRRAAARAAISVAGPTVTAAARQ
jgi:hypothetical protein